ncbi:MAG: hypothetical protein JST66_05300 [Bacteroidetes bacterium]|nr:hypothetical protein [Bacteroidota bacterium]
MLDGTPSIDNVFLPLKEIVRQGDNPLKQPMCSFLKNVNELLSGRKNLPEHAVGLRDEQFALRIRAIEWVVSENIDLGERCSALNERFQKMEAKDGRDILLANIRFALHAQLEVLKAMENSGVELSQMDTAPLEQLSGLQFSQFESALLVGVPNQQAAHILLGWMHASMDTEVALLMGDAVLNEEIRITPLRIDALNRYLVNAAQTYAASARLLGIIPSTDMSPQLAAEPLPAAWVRGQQRLADRGLGDWLRL